jgi:hypothetical protein
VTVLAKVEDSFDLFGRCVVVFRSVSGDHRLWTGDPVQLRTPNGQLTDTKVAGIADVKRFLLQHNHKASVDLPRGITKHNLPPGSEIWLLKPPGENL